MGDNFRLDWERKRGHSDFFFQLQKHATTYFGVEFFLDEDTARDFEKNGFPGELLSDAIKKSIPGTNNVFQLITEERAPSKQAISRIIAMEKKHSFQKDRKLTESKSCNVK